MKFARLIVLALALTGCGVYNRGTLACQPYDVGHHTQVGCEAHVDNRGLVVAVWMLRVNNSYVQRGEVAVSITSEQGLQLIIHQTVVPPDLAGEG